MLKLKVIEKRAFFSNMTRVVKGRKTASAKTIKIDL